MNLIDDGTFSGFYMLYIAAPLHLDENVRANSTNNDGSYRTYHALSFEPVDFTDCWFASQVVEEAEKMWKMCTPNVAEAGAAYARLCKSILLADKNGKGVVGNSEIALDDFRYPLF